ncbi:MAG: hypothetical protein ACFFCQ_05685 [Promethearchaeota archaeon]
MKFANILLLFILLLSYIHFTSKIYSKNSPFDQDRYDVIDVTEDEEAPVLSDIQIEPAVINHSTTHISVFLNAADPSGVESLLLQVCSSTVCFNATYMILGLDGQWSATMNVSDFISSINVLYLKVTAKDTQNNTKTYDIGIYTLVSSKTAEMSSYERNTGITPSFTAFLAFLLLTSLLLIKKARK